MQAVACYRDCVGSEKIVIWSLDRQIDPTTSSQQHQAALQLPATARVVPDFTAVQRVLACSDIPSPEMLKEYVKFFRRGVSTTVSGRASVFLSTEEPPRSSLTEQRLRNSRGVTCLLSLLPQYESRLAG